MNNMTDDQFDAELVEMEQAVDDIIDAARQDAEEFQAGLDELCDLADQIVVAAKDTRVRAGNEPQRAYARETLQLVLERVGSP